MGAAEAELQGLAVGTAILIRKRIVLHIHTHTGRAEELRCVLALLVVDVIATEPGSSARPVIFAYEQGAQMAVGAAPARRVGLYPAYGTPNSWTDDGAALFDAAVAWLADAEPPANIAPVVDAGDNVTVGPAASADLVGTVTDDGLPNPPATVALRFQDSERSPNG